MKKYILGLVAIAAFINVTQAQTGISATGVGPDPGTMLDVIAADKGFMLPRVALTATNVAAPVTLLTATSTSTLVYNTNTAGTAPTNVTPGFYYWDNAVPGWVRIISGNTNALRWDQLAAPNTNLTLAHGANATVFNFGAVTSDAFSFNGTSAAQTFSTLAVSSNSTAAFASGGIHYNFTGAHTGNGFQIDDVTATGNAMAINANSVTTGRALAISTNGLTTGTGLNISSASTAGTASSSSTLLNLARSGANANASHTAYGIQSAVTNTGATNTNIAGYFSASGATNSYGIIVPSGGGNVGIGTGSPLQLLEIGGTGGTARLNGVKSGGSYNVVAPLSSYVLYTTSAGDVSSLPAVNNATLTTNGSGQPAWVSTSATVTANAWSLTGNTGTTPSAAAIGSAVTAGSNFIGTTDNKDLVIATNDGTSTLERMRVRSTGNVGIATNAPVTRFQLNSKVSDDNAYVYDANSAYFVHPTPTATATLNDPKTILMLARQGTSGQAYGAAAAFNLSRYENVGVNSRTRLDISLANASFDATSNNIMTLLSSGNVGIGTTGPLSQLHTTGTVRFGNYTSGMLGTDASGILQTRTITGTTNQIDLTNGNGVAGNPTVNINPSYTADLKANANMTGGGTVTYISSVLKWTARFIIISNGNGAHFGTSGYFDISVPAVSTVITGLGGASNATVTASGIPLASWQALYYILPIGSGNGSVDANFRIVYFTGAQVVPETWVLVAVVNGDDGSVRLGNGITLAPGGTYSPLSGYINNQAVNATFATGQAASFDVTGNGEINGTLNVNGNVGIGTTSTTAAKLDVNGDVYIKGTGGINQHSGSYTASATGIKEMFRVASAGLCTGGTFTIYATRGNFVHVTQWAWSSNHPSKGVLTQLTGGDYSNIPVYLDVDGPGNAIISADWGASQGYSINIQKTSGGAIDVSANGTSWTTVNTGYTRVRSLTSISNGFQTADGVFSGFVGIGTGISGTYRLNVSGKLKTDGIDENSDIRLKKDINPINDALHKVMQLNGVTYNWRKDEFPERNMEDGLQYGLIAQELEKVIPELVTTDEKGWKSVEYSHLVPVLIESIKELEEKNNKQQSVIDDQQKINTELKTSLENLITRMAALENTVGGEINKAEK